MNDVEEIRQARPRSFQPCLRQACPITLRFSGSSVTVHQDLYRWCQFCRSYLVNSEAREDGGTTARGRKEAQLPGPGAQGRRKEVLTNPTVLSIHYPRQQQSLYVHMSVVSVGRGL